MSAFSTAHGSRIPTEADWLDRRELPRAASADRRPRAAPRGAAAWRRFVARLQFGDASPRADWSGIGGRGPSFAATTAGTSIGSTGIASIASTTPTPTTPSTPTEPSRGPLRAAATRSILHRLPGAMMGLLRAWHRERRIAAGIVALGALDDRMLCDLGVSRDEIARAARTGSASR